MYRACLFNSRFCSQSMFLGQLKRLSLKALRVVNTARLSLLVLQKRSGATSPSAPHPPPPATARAESADGNTSGICEDEDAGAAEEEGGGEGGGEGEGEEEGQAQGGGLGGINLREEETEEGDKKTQTRKPLRLGHGRNNFRIDFA
jgi:hypothetical protein